MTDDLPGASTRAVLLDLAARRARALLGRAIGERDHHGVDEHGAAFALLDQIRREDARGVRGALLVTGLVSVHLVPTGAGVGIEVALVEAPPVEGPWMPTADTIAWLRAGGGY